MLNERGFEVSDRTGVVALRYMDRGSQRHWYARLHLHLAVATIPVLAISAHVLVSLSRL